MTQGMTACIALNVQFYSGPYQTVYSVPLITCTRLLYRWWSLKLQTRRQAQRLTAAITVAGIGLAALRFGLGV